MHVQHIRRRLEKQAAAGRIQFSVGDLTTDEALDGLEDRLHTRLPVSIRSFYVAYNGTYVEDPRLDVLAGAVWTNEHRTG